MNEELSIIIPSKNPPKMQLAAQLWGRGLSDSGTNEFNLFPVVGAPDIATGYNAAIDRVTTPYVLLAHDDAYPLSYPRYFCYQRLIERMRDVDILGFCGSDRFCGASWQASGSLYGQVINHPALPEPIDPASMGLVQTGMRPCSVAIWHRPARLIRGIRVADGYAVVCRVDALKKIGGFWTPESAKGFHHYDLALFLTAWEAGLRTAVASDIYISHSSHGSYHDPTWAAGVPEFFGKFDGKADPSYGVGMVHTTIQTGDSRMALHMLQDQERFMADEVTVRENPNAPKGSL